MARNDRFRIVAFVDKPEPYVSYKVWPEHLPLTPWAEGNRPSAVKRIAQAIANIGTVQATIASEVKLGIPAPLPIWYVEPSEQIQRLHDTVIGAVNFHRTHIDFGEPVGERYLPLIIGESPETIHNPGDVLHIRNISAIGAFQGLGPIVFDSISFGGQ